MPSLLCAALNTALRLLALVKEITSSISISIAVLELSSSVTNLNCGNVNDNSNFALSYLHFLKKDYSTSIQYLDKVSVDYIHNNKISYIKSLLQKRRYRRAKIYYKKLYKNDELLKQLFKTSNLSD